MFFLDVLIENDLAEVANVLKEECIEENCLIMIDEQMLERMGVKPMGKRLKTLKLLKEHLHERKSSQDKEMEPDDGIEPTLDTSTSTVPLSESSASSETDLPFELPYPQFSAEIVKAEKDGDINLVRSKLIRQSAKFFMSLKYDLRPDYDRICRHLIERFPQLEDTYSFSGALHNHSRLKKDLSQSVRNQKRPRLLKSDSPIRPILDLNEKVASISGSDLHCVKVQLTKLGAKSSILNEDHISNLLDEIFLYYKNWMSTPKSISEIREEFPFLELPIVMVVLCGKMLGHTEFQQFTFMNLRKVYDVIVKIMKLEEDEDEPEEMKILSVLKYVEKYIMGKNDKSIFCELDELSKQPCIVVSSTGNTISQTFLAVDKELFSETRFPDVFQTIQLWIAAHYNFNIEYAKHNKAFAYFLEDTILKECGSASIQRQTTKRRKVARSTKTEDLYQKMKGAGFVF